MNDTGGPPNSDTVPLRIRSVDGTVYWLVNHSQVDYVLHPVFLRFIVAACLIYALLDNDTELKELTGWLIWAQVILVILLWLAMCGGIIRLLFRHNLIKQVWTPALLLPMIILIEAMVHAMYFAADLPPKPMGATLVDLTRDGVIVLLFDFLHGHYVVARHPLARSQRSAPAFLMEPSGASLDTLSPADGQQKSELAAGIDEASGTTVSQTPAVSALAGRSAPGALRTGSVLIGSETFGLSDILMIRIEDHYLSITTRSGRSLQRAKLAAVNELHHGDLGIQINRSVWVAFQAIRDVQSTQNGQLLVVLANGDEELVAKPRVYAFRQSYRLWSGDSVPPAN